MTVVNRKQCHNCYNDETEFHQFGGADQDVTMTEPSDVGSGVLEVRYCSVCGAAIENVLTVDSRKTLP